MRSVKRKGQLVTPTWIDLLPFPSFSQLRHDLSLSFLFSLLSFPEVISNEFIQSSYEFFFFINPSTLKKRDPFASSSFSFVKHPLGIMETNTGLALSAFVTFLYSRLLGSGLFLLFFSFRPPDEAKRKRQRQ